tara:strand:+ start:257 stop:463 length:207 start_codon:yes stop_codon:yes gene_type:complete
MKPKAYQVTFINFDFSGVDDVTQEEMDEAVDEALSNVWYADDEDDLVEEITAATGWCINSIDYDHILK